MGKRIQKKRILLLVALLALAFTGLGYKLVDLQVLRHEELLAAAGRYTQRTDSLTPLRGDILDAQGNLLATSIFVKTVCADPMLIGNYSAEVARAIAPLLKMDENKLRQQLTPRVSLNEQGKAVTNRYVRLKTKVPVETWQRIQAVMNSLTFGANEKKMPKSQQAFFRDLRASAIHTEAVDDQMRKYPNGALAAHVLGFVGMKDAMIGTNRVQELAGLEGIEAGMNDPLTGTTGRRVTGVDSRRQEIVPLRGQELEARDGLNVVLTINSVVQHELESALTNAMREFRPASASGIVIRPRTGEILAMATLPNFDPNHPGDATDDARRNRVITDMVEPGSTFKTIVISAAMNEGLAGLNDVFYCENGAFPFAGRVLHDSEGHQFGNLTLAEILFKSSNIGAAKVGIKLGPEKLYDYIQDYGFGARTGIPLPAEYDCRFFVQPVKKWSKVSIAQIPMGQGVGVTRLQMAMAICAIANDGWLMRPKLVDRLEDHDHNVVVAYPPQRVRQVISEPTARKMIEALKRVVSADGTAPRAALTNYTVAGKTGTAQKTVPGIAGYAPGKYVSSFIGFFPADNPEVCISIVLDEPSNGYYGGATAAPTFKLVAERVANYLNILPDRTIDNSKALKVYARTITKP